MSTQKPKSDKAKLTVRIIFPDRPHVEVVCDSLKLTAVDNKKGEKGGIYGIRANHAPAVFALIKGNIRAELGGTKVLDAEIGDGYARVENNTVTVLTESCADE